MDAPDELVLFEPSLEAVRVQKRSVTHPANFNLVLLHSATKKNRVAASDCDGFAVRQITDAHRTPRFNFRGKNPRRRSAACLFWREVYAALKFLPGALGGT